MGMRIDSRDRLGIKSDLRDTRVYGRTLAVLLPTLTICTSGSCGYDAQHDSGVDPSCTICDGLGRTATFAICNIYANIRTVEQSLVTFGQAPPGAEVGDTFITFGQRDYDTILSCQRDKDAYVSVDGGCFRPTPIQVAGVGQAEEYVVVLKSFKPLFRAPGY